MAYSNNLLKQERLSVITASILVCYASLPFVRVPAREVSFLIFGVFVSFRLSFYNIISIITASIAACGMAWLLFDHPSRGKESIYPHLILPALTTGVIGYPLGLIETDIAWWVILALGTILIVFILISEYISFERRDIRYPMAMMVLSGASYTLLLIFTIALRYADLRLYQTLMLLSPVYAFFNLRILKLRLGGRWQFEWTAVITLIITQIIIALFYWPLSPIRFGLLVVGPAYALNDAASAVIEKPNAERTFIGPLIMLGIFWLSAIFIG